MKNQKELDAILKKLEEIEKTLSDEELHEFVEKLGTYFSRLRCRLASVNRELEEEQFGGWL